MGAVLRREQNKKRDDSWLVRARDRKLARYDTIWIYHYHQTPERISTPRDEELF